MAKQKLREEKGGGGIKGKREGERERDRETDRERDRERETERVSNLLFYETKSCIVNMSKDFSVKVPISAAIKKKKNALTHGY